MGCRGEDARSTQNNGKNKHLMEQMQIHLQSHFLFVSMLVSVSTVARYDAVFCFSRCRFGGGDKEDGFTKHIFTDCKGALHLYVTL